MVVSLLAALLAALCYGVASVMQAIAVRAASRRSMAQVAQAGEGVDAGLLVRMARQGLFLASVAIDIVGFVAQLIALRRLPLFAVQAIMASNLAVTAVCAAWIMKARLAVREWLAVAGVVAGVALLGLSAGSEGAAKVGREFELGLIIAVAVVGVTGFAVARLPNPVRTPALGAIAGLGYGALAVAARILPGFGPLQLIKSPAAYTVAAAGILSFLLYATALEGGSVTTATAAVILAETAPPAIVGVLFLGDKTRPGLTAVAVLGFALAVACALALARFGEASERSEVAHNGSSRAGATAGRRAA
jgi:drug/metabolite transporter (DMT)-like permease